MASRRTFRLPYLLFSHLAVLILTGVLLPAWSRAEENGQSLEAADWLPASTLLYAEIPQPRELLDQLMEHPLGAEIREFEGVQDFYARPEYKQLLLGLTAAEGALGKPWREAVSNAIEGGLYLGFDASTEGAVLLARGKDAAAVTRLRDAFVTLARADAQRRKADDPVKQADYRGIQANEINEAKFAVIGPWLLVTQKGDLGKLLIDRWHDGTPQPLSQVEAFKQARASRDAKNQAWAWAHLEPVRQAGEANELFSGKTENPAAELLVGGLMSVFQHATYLTGSFHLDDNSVGLSFKTPYRPEWIEEVRQYYFGEDGRATGPNPVTVDNMILSVTAYRDVSHMWLRAGDLFDEQMNDQLAQADSGLSTLFSGQDFGEDILGAIEPEVQVIVARQTFDDVLPRPSIKVPGFALVAQLRNVEAMQPQLRRTFQSLIGFFNVAGAMNGQPQMDLGSEIFQVDNQEARMYSSTFAPEVEERESTQARINFNFSPSVGFVGNYVVVSSTSELARKILSATAGTKTATSDTNSHIALHAGPLYDVLKDNQSHLISQNMLEEGNSREEAETQISALLDILRLFEGATLALTPEQDALRLSLELKRRAE